ncbi:MAG: carboxyl transferase domain-containing protein [Thermoplasmatota archaeon]
MAHMEPDDPKTCELEPAESDILRNSNDTHFSQELYNQSLAAVADWVERSGGDPKKAFVRVLIVNNGLSALRIIQGLTSLSNLISGGKNPNLIQAVAIASDADWVGDCLEDAQQRPNYLKEPDIIIARIPGMRPKDTYQNQEEVILLARNYKCDAIAVGWGHLAENISFASRVEKEGLIFIGPDAKAMSLMGDKIMSKLIMDEAKVPMLPWNGSNISLSEIRKEAEDPKTGGEQKEGISSETDRYRKLFDQAYERVGVNSIEYARSVVDSISLPVVIKATAGGGGRGIRFITNEKDLESGLQAAISEASAAFGNGTVFIEKAADPGSRHVEVQILADTAGTVIALGERECSIQRHNQKLIEESGDDIPISDTTRRTLREAAVAAAKAANYVNAGTVEFLVDRGGNPYFMEMNTRLQVEHIATEAVFPGLDLVVEQLKIAMGIPLDQELISISESLTTGRHAISVRITAENPNAGFSSQTGTIETLDIPNLGPNTPRAYFSFSQGGTVHSFADSQIGHVVVSAPTRESARQHMVAFLNKLRIKGILTNLLFSSAIMQDAEYIDGKGIHVSWLKQRLEDAQSNRGASLGGSKVQPEMGLAAIAIFDYLFQKAESQDKFHANLISSRSIAPRLLANTGMTRVKYGKLHHTVIVREIADELYELLLDNDRIVVRFWERLGPSRFMMEYEGIVYQVHRIDETSITHIEVGGQTITFERNLDPHTFRAPMAGIISSVDVKPGQTVGANDTLFTMEAMKMISSLASPRHAVIAEVYTDPGSIVEVGTPLLKFAEEEDTGKGSVPSLTQLEEEGARLHFKHDVNDLSSRLERKWAEDGNPDIPVNSNDIRTVIGSIMRGYQFSNIFLDLLLKELTDMKKRLNEGQWIALVRDTIVAFYKDEQYFKGFISLSEGLSIAEKEDGIIGEEKYALARSHGNLSSKKTVLLKLLEPISSMDFQSIVPDLEKLTDLGYSDNYRDLSTRAEELIHLIHPLHEKPIDLHRVMEDIVEAHEAGDISLQNDLMKNIMAATESMVSELIRYLVSGSGFARKIAGKLIILRAYRRHKGLTCEYEHIEDGKRLYIWRFNDADTDKDRMGLVSLVEPGEGIEQSLSRMYERLRQLWEESPERADHTGDVLEMLIQWPPDITSSEDLAQHLEDIVNNVVSDDHLRRITFVVQIPQDQMPGFFTFRPDEEGGFSYREDTLCRNLHPSLTYLLNLKQLESLKSNIVKLPSADPLIHIFHHRIPNPRGSELPDIENRIFVRTVIRNSEITMGPEGPSFPAAEEAFATSLRHLRVSYAATGARSHNNQIYLAFAKPITLSFEEYQKIVKRMNQHMGEYSDVDLTKTEIRGRLDSWQATGRSIDMLLVVENPTGLLTEMKEYVITSDVNDGKKVQMLLPYNEFVKQHKEPEYTPSGSLWMPFSELIKPMNAVDKKRVTCRQKGKAYVYDRLSLLRNELACVWANSGKERPEGILTAKELITEPDGEVVPIDRPPGVNDLSIVAWRVHIRSPEAESGRELIVVSGDMTLKGGSVSTEEDVLFAGAAKIARDEGIPFVYFAEGSGARIGLATIVTQRLSYDDREDVFFVDERTYSLLEPLVVGHRDPVNGSRYIITSILGGLPDINVAEEDEYLYISEATYNRFKDRMTAHPTTVTVGSKEKTRWVIDSIEKQFPLINFENLSGSAMMARACSLTYHSVPTMAVVTDTCTGIIAYNVRLLKRIVQTRNSEIILTGYRALNSLYGGDDVYSSNRELGGPHIMGPNGVSHHIVKDESQACKTVLSWLAGVPVKRGYPSPILRTTDPVDRDISGALIGPGGLIEPPRPEAERPVPYDSMELVRIIFDKGSVEEAMEEWGGTVHVGRATIGGHPVGFISVETRTVEKVVPADPSIEGSAPVRINQFGQVWYPDSAYKTSQWIQFMKYERRPIIILPNWRGFAGGKIDLYEEIIKFGATIVDELVCFDLPVILYFPPFAELRGGAWVVIDSQINPDRIVLIADEHATGSILEPSGMESVPLIQRQIQRDMIQQDPVLSELYGNRTKFATQMDRIKKIDKQIEEREREIWPKYVKKWTKIFRLHNTAERMGAIGIASEVVPTSKAREAIYRALMNGLKKDVSE